MNSIQKIHQEAMACAKRFLENQVALIEVLVRVIQHRVHDHLGFGSLTDYCMKELKLSYDQAHAFIGIARKSIEIPEMKTLVQEGKLTVSNARKIVPHIQKENKEFWLEKAVSLPQRQLEKEIVKVKPAAAVIERVKPIAENLNSLLLLIQDEDEKLWYRANEVMNGKHGKLEKREVFVAAMKALLEKEDPVTRAERLEAKRLERVEKQQVKAGAQKAVMTSPAPAASSRTPVPNSIQRQVFLRDRGQCTHIHQGQRCTNRNFLHLHHLLPLAMGGTHSVQNLVTLCSSHHRLVHRELDVSYALGVRPKLSLPANC